jgi:hypothetical protein
MASLNPIRNITVDGTYHMGPSPTASYSYKVDGTFGGGTVEVGYSSSGTFIKYADITALTANGQGVITCGIGTYIAFRLTGSTAASIFLTINLV